MGEVELGTRAIGMQVFNSPCGAIDYTIDAATAKSGLSCGPFICTLRERPRRPGLGRMPIAAMILVEGKKLSTAPAQRVQRRRVQDRAERRHLTHITQPLQ